MATLEERKNKALGMAKRKKRKMEKMEILEIDKNIEDGKNRIKRKNYGEKKELTKIQKIGFLLFYGSIIPMAVVISAKELNYIETVDFWFFDNSFNDVDISSNCFLV